MSWRDYEPEYIPKYTWLCLVFRWEKTATARERELDRKKKQAIIEERRRRKAEAERERKRKKAEQQDKREFEREKRRKEKERQKRERAKQNPIYGPRTRKGAIELVDKHVSFCGRCKQKGDLCKIAEALTELLK